MGYRVTSKKDQPSWRYGQNEKIQAGESFVVDSNNLNGHALKLAIEKQKGVNLTSSLGSVSENDWIIEKL